MSKIFTPGLLEGAVCIVSGAGTGLGRAAATELAGLGARVIICGRRKELLDDVVKSLGSGAEAIRVDIRDEEGVNRLVDEVLERHGRIDVLVNNAGGQFMAPAETITPKGFKTVVELNALGTWQMISAVANKAMIPQRSGKIINVTLSPHNGFPGLSHAGAARAAVENMTKALSVEWARYGIVLNAIAAGHFDTEVLHNKYPEVVGRSAPSWPPLGRLGTAEEFAWLVAFLASPAGSYFSGSVITMDGARDNWYGPWPPPGLYDGDVSPTEDRKNS
jgi:citronellol/citronellal dehydrogenase